MDMEKNNNMIDRLRDYYDTNSKDKIKKDNDNTKKFNESGITVDEFFDELNDRIEKWN